MLRGYVFELFMNAFFPDFREKKRERGQNKRRELLSNFGKTGYTKDVSSPGFWNFDTHFFPDETRSDLKPISTQIFSSNLFVQNIFSGNALFLMLSAIKVPRSVKLETREI